MASTNIITVPAISAFSSNITTTTSMALGNTYDDIYFEFSKGTDRERISNIQVLINGKTIRSYKNVQDLLDENSYFGYPDGVAIADNPNSIAIHFDQEWLRQLNEVKSLGIGTAGNGAQAVSTFNIRWDNSAGIIGNVKCWAKISEPKALGPIIFNRQFPKNVVAGINDIADFPRQGNLVAAFFKSSDGKQANNIKNIEVIRANKTIFNVPNALNKKLLARAIPRPRGLSTNDNSAKYFIVDNCLDGSLSGFVDLRREAANDFRFRINAGVADPGMVVSLLTVNSLQGG